MKADTLVSSSGSRRSRPRPLAANRSDDGRRAAEEPTGVDGRARERETTGATTTLNNEKKNKIKKPGGGADVFLTILPPPSFGCKCEKYSRLTR